MGRLMCKGWREYNDVIYKFNGHCLWDAIREPKRTQVIELWQFPSIGEVMIIKDYSDPIPKGLDKPMPVLISCRFYASIPAKTWGELERALRKIWEGSDEQG